MPILAAAFVVVVVTVNISAAVYVAASVFCQISSGGLKKIRQLIKPSAGCFGKQATILNIAMNSDLAVMEIHTAWE